MKTDDGLVKPVYMISVEERPDGNPQYQKVIDYAITYFRKNNLDGLFIFTNKRTGEVCFQLNRAADGSEQGLVRTSSPEYYGNHLDLNGKTIDAELGKKNFQFAGETIYQISSELKIDGHM